MALPPVASGAGVDDQRQQGGKVLREKGEDERRRVNLSRGGESVIKYRYSSEHS